MCVGPWAYQERRPCGRRAELCGHLPLGPRAHGQSGADEPLDLTGGGVASGLFRSASGPSVQRLDADGSAPSVRSPLAHCETGY